MSENIREKVCEVPVIVVYQSQSCVRLFVTPRQVSLSFTISRSLLKLMSIESVMPSNYVILHCPLLISPSVFPSIRVFSSESAFCIRWPKYWSFSFSVNPSNEYSGFISFRMDCFDLLVVPGTLKSLFQHCSSKSSILCCSTFLIVQLSHLFVYDYWINVALTRWTFVGKVISLVFNILFMTCHSAQHILRYLIYGSHLFVSCAYVEIYFQLIW